MIDEMKSWIFKSNLSSDKSLNRLIKKTREDPNEQNQQKR